MLGHFNVLETASKVWMEFYDFFFSKISPQNCDSQLETCCNIQPSSQSRIDQSYECPDATSACVASKFCFNGFIDQSVEHKAVRSAVSRLLNQFFPMLLCLMTLLSNLFFFANLYFLCHFILFSFQFFACLHFSLRSPRELVCRLKRNFTKKLFIFGGKKKWGLVDFVNLDIFKCEIRWRFCERFWKKKSLIDFLITLVKC